MKSPTEVMDAETDLWAQGANIDRNSSQPTVAAVASTDEDDPWEKGSSLTQHESAGLNKRKLAEMLQAPDQELLEALAERDPKARAELEEQNAERISVEFRAKNPGYLKTAKNSHVLIQTLALTHLKTDYLDDDDAIRVLYQSGKWTVETLTATYKQLLKAGRLDVPKGGFRELTKEEKLKVIALLRAYDAESALMTFISYSLGENAPEFDSPEGLLAAYPQLASRAALFVWYHSQADVIDREQFADFQRSTLAGRPILTIEFIGRAWASYQRKLKDAPAAPPTIPIATTETREAFENLSKAELDALRARSVAELRMGRK